ncbi:MAG: hypothetical protein A2V67_15020 [Deltaproteobacteria bacterium RBG_13_61_14]|nr:MAG: hypothetical protein A2V67_15020 [Deltaproteobacteria bacterium RBG_13_61_14]
MPVERVTRVKGSSPISFQDALEEGLNRANKTLRGITQMDVLTQKARVQQGQIKEYVVEVDITFILEE